MPVIRSPTSVTMRRTMIAAPTSPSSHSRYVTRGSATRRASADGGDSCFDNYVPQLPRQREICTPEQKAALEDLYELTAGYPSTSQRLELASRIGKSPESTYIWFQNKRNSATEKKKRSAKKNAMEMSISGSDSNASNSSGSSRAPSSAGLPSPSRSILHFNPSSTEIFWEEQEIHAIDVLTNALRTMPDLHDQHAPIPIPAGSNDSCNDQHTFECPLLHTPESVACCHERMPPPRTNVNDEPRNLRVYNRVVSYSEVSALRGLAEFHTQILTF
ncbi:SubName: Full=Uncharacterized protein {ECO:0000313/EMBL:CCA66451.1} [Serendipita indica DSM 11827]|uniref:Homeobox domain-containing protein n=1 Tax=Serendipita indica (strain DSM 11827) TaxID=1109443 RepID=G4T591_SERID|nr:SubName: Full=Uncharacterized protein {ECO:0000313/EMBL:CCA66451.1} [Serendipita indica DSM 11827]CCA66451.1 hypothetical protein PIIN_00137 [Serendipita indica DSM 11827]